MGETWKGASVSGSEGGSAEGREGVRVRGCEGARVRVARERRIDGSTEQRKYGGTEETTYANARACASVRADLAHGSRHPHGDSKHPPLTPRVLTGILMQTSSEHFDCLRSPFSRQSRRWCRRLCRQAVMDALATALSSKSRWRLRTGRLNLTHSVFRCTPCLSERACKWAW